MEYAFILPVLLLFVLGIMDTGRLIWTYTTLNRAAEAAARCAAVDTVTCGTVTATQSYAVTQAYGLNVDTTAFTPSTAACGARVAATYTFQFTIPWIGGAPYGTSNSTALTATACYPPSH
ncbi:MAG TPA: TadE family protein [Micropepsaceae bacterium]|nr:TadE family protein [Micropepsaceae bacterium]